MRYAFMVCLLLAYASVGSASLTFVYDRPICTGLGDRLGLILSLSALARVENARIVFFWCSYPAPSTVFSRITPFIPTWHGYNVSFHSLHALFAFPSDILVQPDTHAAAYEQLPRVQWLPVENGWDSIYSTAWQTMHLGTPTAAVSFFNAYRAIGARFYRSSKTCRVPYLVLHLRGPDANTPLAYGDTSAFCTRRVLPRLQALRLPVLTISNNASWARHMLRMDISEGDVLMDLGLLWNASAVVVHVVGGWSSYSMVPALARGIPVLSTYRGPTLRPPTQEIYECAHMETFIRKVVALL